MRCYICDCSDDTPSAYYLGLSINSPRVHKVKIDPITKNPICQSCLEAAKSWLLDRTPKTLDGEVEELLGDLD